MDKANLARHVSAMTPKRPFSAKRQARDRSARLSAALLDVTGPLQVFASANALTAKAGNAEPYDVRVVAKDGPTVEASAGVGLAVQPLPTIGSAVDTLVIPGGDGVNAAAADAVLVDWVRKRAGDARRTASVCTGAFLLAASGALDGRRAVTHWGFWEELAERFPAVRVESDPIFVRDGSFWTSAGVTSGIDLALALVEDDLGRATASPSPAISWCFSSGPADRRSSAVLSLQTTDDRFGALHD